MKNRRLNVLFIAIIALAAAPQALQDAHRLANAAQERVETEFWSVFLSYRTQDSTGTEKVDATELVAARRQRETTSSCPLEQKAVQSVEVARNAQVNESSQRVRAVNAEARRASAKATPNSPVTVEADFDEDEEAASEPAMLEAAFTGKEQKALKSAGLHARDAEKIANLASKATLASFFEQSEDAQIKVRQIEVDNLLRQKIRYIEDSSKENDEIPTPETFEGM